MKRTCVHCGRTFDASGRGRIPKTCGATCRQANRRASAIPTILSTRATWTRRDGKRPIMCDGSPASSTNPATWTTYKAVKAGAAGDGYGIMLGSGLGCYDLDHCLDERGCLPDDLAAWVRSLTPIFVERSMSKTGIHVFVYAEETRGWKKAGVEFYSRARFIAVTEDRLEL